MESRHLSLDGHSIRLVPMSTEHCEGLCRAVSDGKLWELNVTLIPEPELMSAWVGAALDAREQGRSLPFTIVWKATGEIVGATRFDRIEPIHRKVEITWTWIAESWQRTAVNTEAKFLLLRYAFEQMGFIRVEFVADVLNVKSLRALIRIGAKVEGVMRNHMIMKGGRHRDSYSLSIIDTEWPAVKEHLVELLKPRS